MKTQALLCVVTITGLWTLSLCLSHHQYHLVKDQMNWTDAQQYCRDKFTDLATIHTMEDVTLARMVDSQINAWIGLYNDVTSWRWSLADQRFYEDAEEHAFRKWAPGQPNDKLCAWMYGHNGSWAAGSCGIKRFSICFDDNTDQTRKYVVNEERLPWSEAQRECRKKHTDLASVRNQAELEEIQEAVDRQGKKACWIGLHRHSWKWSDGSSYSFRHWNDWQPDGGLMETCAFMRFAKGSKWGDSKCNNKAPFICYSVKKPVLRVKLAINSSLDVNDPAVQDAILEQLKQNLKDHQGAPADIRVRWVEQADGRIFHKGDKKKKEKKRETKKLTKREL